MSKRSGRSNVEKKDEQKSKIEIRLAIINLVLTAIIGIGVAFVLNSINNKLTKDIQASEEKLALELQVRDEQQASELRTREEEFLKEMEATQEAFTREMGTRQEDFQKEMAQLQNEIEEKANQARLKLSMVCFNGGMMCSNVVFIGNQGPSTAKNIRAVLYIDEVNEIWLDDLQDVNNFDLIIDPTELSIETKHIHVSPMYGLSYQIQGNNAIEFTLPSLPANGWFRIYLMPSANLDHDIKTINRLLEVDSSIALGNAWTDPYLYFAIDELYPLAMFRATATCENCLETENNEYRFPVGGSVHTILKPIEQNDKNSLNLRKYSLEVEYMVPKEYEGVLETSDVRFKLVTSPQYNGYHFERDYSSR